MYIQLYLDQSDSKILKITVTQEKCELLSYFFDYGYISRGVTNQCSIFKVKTKHARSALK